MSAITFTVTIIGTPDEEDRRTGKFLVDKYNADQLALDPPGATLPVDTPAEIKSSLETLIGTDVLDGRYWPSIIKQASEASVADKDIKTLWKEATDAQRAAAEAALTT